MAKSIFISSYSSFVLKILYAYEKRKVRKIILRTEVDKVTTA
jgi:hypothetical protein